MKTMSTSTSMIIDAGTQAVLDELIGLTPKTAKEAKEQVQKIAAALTQATPATAEATTTPTPTADGTTRRAAANEVEAAATVWVTNWKTDYNSWPIGEPTPKGTEVNIARKMANRLIKFGGLTDGEWGVLVKQLAAKQQQIAGQAVYFTATAERLNGLWLNQ